MAEDPSSIRVDPFEADTLIGDENEVHNLDEKIDNRENSSYCSPGARKTEVSISEATHNAEYHSSEYIMSESDNHGMADNHADTNGGLLINESFSEADSNVPAPLQPVDASPEASPKVSPTGKEVLIEVCQHFSGKNLSYV
jgi:hypothetical protein